MWSFLDLDGGVIERRFWGVVCGEDAGYECLVAVKGRRSRRGGR